tara:strand:- start:447 stop:656 length:210 start_codon:yes stop_codon:yes gene_type:complete
MSLLVTEIKFDYSSNTNPFHSPITEDGKHQIEAETKSLLWDAQNHTELVNAIEETYGWFVEKVKFREAK